LVDLKKQVQILKVWGKQGNTEIYGLVIGKYFGRINIHGIGKIFPQKKFQTTY
jgi:hypothetical protein